MRRQAAASRLPNVVDRSPRLIDRLVARWRLMAQAEIWRSLPTEPASLVDVAA
jgi:hypothetical protein